MGRSQELLNASREGDRVTVEKLLQLTRRSGPFPSLRRCAASVNVQDDNGYTSLHYASLNGHTEIVQLLLLNDASPIAADKNGLTPLHLAAFNGHSDVVRVLLAHKNPPVNINQTTVNNETALHFAAQFDYVEVVAQLLSRDADITIKNKGGYTALDLAAHFGKFETVKHLLRVRPELMTPYKPPVYCGNVLLESTTPLHLAAKNGSKEVVAALIGAGMDPDIRTSLGTPLHEAARYGKVSVALLLLRRGAELNAWDSNNRTVMQEATKNVQEAIRNYLSRSRYSCATEDDVPPFPIHDDSPTPAGKAPETQKNTNTNDTHSLLSPSTSSLTKNHPQSFVKKLASKCLVLKSKFSSAPNISNSTGAETEVDSKSKRANKKQNSNNTLLIGNSKFFKILSKKEESGEIDCSSEFDTISLDRLGTLNRDSTVNRSNRSCPGFKTSLPNISENNELIDSDESTADSVVITELDCEEIHTIPYDVVTEAINCNPNLNIFEPRSRTSIISSTSASSTNLINEYYESYEFESNIINKKTNYKSESFPRPPPRSNINSNNSNDQNAIYENIKNITKIPTPAVRTHIPVKTVDETEKKVVYENISIIQQKNNPDPPKRNNVPLKTTVSVNSDNSERVSLSRSSTLSSDSMEDETNLEDILLSQKSKSFRHGKIPSVYSESVKYKAYRTESNASDSSDATEASAIENVDCSEDYDKSIYLSMTGTLPNKTNNVEKKKVLFRHKTFTNIEVDRNSIKVKDLPHWNNDALKETLTHYHIKGTGHCIYKAPTVREFMNMFNRDTLHKDMPNSTAEPKYERDSYFETAICFCKSPSLKHHNSAEDLLAPNEEETVTIDMNALKIRSEIVSTTFKCFCDSGTCTFHSKRREKPIDMVVKFSALKKSISTPDITLQGSPLSTANFNLKKNNSVAGKLEEPYAVVTVDDIIARDKSKQVAYKSNSPESTIPYTKMSPQSTLSSSSSDRLYSIKDISEVISLNSQSTSTASSLCSASDNVHLPVRKSNSSVSGHWSLQSCDSNVTIKSDMSYKTCIDESSENDSDGTLHSDAESSDAETVKSDISTTKRPWVHSDSFRFGSRSKPETETIDEDNNSSFESTNQFGSLSSKFESGISVEGSESSSSGCDDDSGVPRADADVSLNTASLERDAGVVGGVRSGSGRRRWDEAEGMSEGDALSVSSAASSCAPLHLAHHHEYSKVSPTPPKKPPRRNLSVSPTHANSPSSGYSYELRAHARSQDDLDDIQGAKHYLKHGRSVDHYVDGKLSYSEHEENHNSPRVPIPHPRPSLKHRSQPVAITAMYENVAIKEQNPHRKLRRNNLAPTNDHYEPRMTDRVRKYSHQERSSLESLLDDQSVNSPSDCERYSDGPRVGIPLSPTHYDQPPTPDHPPPSAKQAENSIHERIRPLSQLIMEVVEEIRIRKKSQGDIANS